MNARCHKPANVLAAVVVAAAVLLPRANAGTIPYNAALDPSMVIVTNWEGWGTSLCWWANVIGGYPNRSTYASLAFSSLKLNIVRYNIGGGENPHLSNSMETRARMAGFEPTNGVWNWNADANQRWMLRQAISLGANRVVAFANSPPWWMTVSGSVTGTTNGTSNNLQTGYETAFAGYLATVISNLTVLDGVHFDFVTAMNEPTASWWVYGGRQEGCHMSADQQARVVSDLHAALAARNLTTGIDGSEDNDEQSTLNSVNAYGASQSSVALLASHTYGANNPSGIRNLSAGLQKPAWASEYGDGDASGMAMARRIHDDIANAWVRAWIYWQVVDDAGGWGCLLNPMDGSGNTAFTFNRKFYVLSQFSQYISPGCQILSVGDTNTLAAYNPVAKKLFLVAVNDTTNSFLVTYDLSAFSSLPSSATGARTSPTENAQVVPAAPVNNKALTTTLMPNSVTTLILTNAAPAPVGAALRGWYPFEGNTLDASGNGNNGINSGATFVSGKLGALCAQFDGASRYIQLPLVISNHFTISFWLKTTDSASTGQWWAGKGLVDGEVQGAADDFGVCLVGGKVGFGIGNPDVTIISANSINDGLWHHVAATRDALSGQMLLYVDGVLQAAGYGPAGPKGSPPFLRVGSIQAGYTGGFLNGAIDDVQFFGRVYGPEELSQLMNHPPVITTGNGPAAVLAGRTLMLTNSAADPDAPAQSLSWSLLSPPAGATIGAANGVFTWRPAVSQSPSTNVISVRVADNGNPPRAATQTLAITVLAPNPPLLTNFNSLAAAGFDVFGDWGPAYAILSSTNLHDWTTLFVTNPLALPFHFSLSGPLHGPAAFYRVQAR